jgi:glycerophosphoryl diester phosphodiesterase
LHPLILAHRGFSAAAPENTLASLALAVEAGADGCEFDVRATKDGHVVVIHDATLQRTTSGRGRVSRSTLAKLKRLDAGSWKDPRFSAQTVPTLEEALALLGGSGCRAVIEIKARGIAPGVVDAVRTAGMIDLATVIAFSRSAIRQCRALEPGLRCGWLCNRAPNGSPARKAAAIAGHAAQCGVDLIDLDCRMLSAALIEQLHGRGLEVWTWTVDDPRRAALLIPWGIDAVTTNDPATMLRVREQRDGLRSQ